MQKKISLRLHPSEAESEGLVRHAISAASAIPPEDITGFYPLKKSIDARSRQVWINLTVNAFIREPFVQRPRLPFHFPDVSRAPHSVVIIGAGPAGLFAALHLIEQGVKPIILERGKDIKSRRRDLAVLNREGIIDPDSNYCFGEGGAGTYSDGKLYTRSTKRGNVDRVLQLLVHFGADERILFESHPHIGTNKLPQIITQIREQIIESGGDVHFEQRVTGFELRESRLHEVRTATGNRFHGDAFIMATGHSARDIFTLLHQHGLQVEAKPFALGVRVEHPQSLIDRLQYHCLVREPGLPAAAYSLVEQVQEKGVFSFCMCPGGIIATASTSPGELVVNGWSPSKRNNPYANSGIVVEVGIKDAITSLRGHSKQENFLETDPLLLMKFQQMVEKNAFTAGGGKFVAPAQCLEDFTRGIHSTTLPDCSYLPGIRSTELGTILPPFIHSRLREGFRAFGRKMKGYLTNDAVVVATESRTSSPVRVPRDPTGMHHPGCLNLYPCGEGAGYAGGIVSAAMDGENAAQAFIKKIGIPLTRIPGQR